MPAARYAQGVDAWGLCKKCGLRFLLGNLLFDGEFPGLRVCRGCYDSRQRQEDPISISDPQMLYKPSPEDAPDNPTLTVTLMGSTVNLSWGAIELRGGARVDAYVVLRAGLQIASLPVTYWGDDLDLADLVENGNPVIGNDGVETEQLTYTDNPPAGQYVYQVIAQLDSGRESASNYVTVNA